MDNLYQRHGNMSSILKKGLCLLILSLAALNLFAQDRMIPSRIWTGKDLRNSETKLFDKFAIKEAERFAFIALPSFDRPYCLSYDCDTKSLILSIGAIYRMHISDSLADSLNALFAAAVLTSSFMGDTLIYIDGTTYKFIISPGYYARAAECWSPDNNTNCGQAVAIIRKLCKAVQENDSKAAEDLMREVVRATNYFRQYYPEDFHQEKFFCGRSQ